MDEIMQIDTINVQENFDVDEIGDIRKIKHENAYIPHGWQLCLLISLVEFLLGVDFTKWMQIPLWKKFYYKNGPHGWKWTWWTSIDNMDENYSVILGHGKFILISKSLHFWMKKEKEKRGKITWVLYWDFSV